MICACENAASRYSPPRRRTQIPRLNAQQHPSSSIRLQWTAKISLRAQAELLGRAFPLLSKIINLSFDYLHDPTDTHSS